MSVPLVPHFARLGVVILNAQMYKIAVNMLAVEIVKQFLRATLAKQPMPFSERLFLLNFQHSAHVKARLLALFATARVRLDF